MGLLVIGVIVLLVGLVNHFVLKANPVAHTSTIVLAVGGVLAVIGVIMMMMGGKQAA
jgi:hypothetical protein